MTDIFISYSFKDKDKAESLSKPLTDAGLDVFWAPYSVRPGERWDEQILSNLKTSLCVLFLASKASCASPVVQQEVGIALGTKKNLIPIVWDMDPSKLPGWVRNVQALDLRNTTLLDSNEQVLKIAKRIKSDKFIGYLIAGLGIAAILYIIARNRSSRCR